MSKNGNIVQYGTFTEDALERDSAKVDQLTGNAFMELLPGENVLRFLPPPIGKNSPFRMTAMHYIEPPPGIEKKMVFACPRHELREACPACEHAARLSSGNAAERRAASEFQPKFRAYANVLDRNNPEAGVKVLGFGKMIYNDLRSIRRNPRTGGDYTNPTETGFDIIITREGTGMNTQYAASADRNNTPLAESDEELMSILAQAHDLEQFVNPEVPEELLMVWGAQTRGVSGGRPAARQITASSPGGRTGAGVVPSRRAVDEVVDVDPFDDEQ